MASKKHKIPVEVIQVTDGGRLLTKSHRKDNDSYIGVATFNRNFKTCYFGGRTFHRQRCVSGGTHICEEDNNEYIVMQKKQVLDLT